MESILARFFDKESHWNRYVLISKAVSSIQRILVQFSFYLNYVFGKSPSPLQSSGSSRWWTYPPWWSCWPPSWGTEQLDAPSPRSPKVSPSPPCWTWPVFSTTLTFARLPNNAHCIVSRNVKHEFSCCFLIYGNLKDLQLEQIIKWIPYQLKAASLLPEVNQMLQRRHNFLLVKIYEVAKIL